MSDASDLEETILCTNCKRDILKSNFVVHDLHCQRFIYVCPVCNEPVNHKEKDAHNEAVHALAFCSHCNAEMDKFLLTAHMSNSCPCRKVNCRYCELEVRAFTLPEHENYCGSRTERCMGCGDYVMLRYMQQHLDSNHEVVTLVQVPPPSPSEVNGGHSREPYNPENETAITEPQPPPKKKSSKKEGKARKTKGSSDSAGKKDETVKEHAKEKKDRKDSGEKSGKIKHRSKELKDPSASGAERKPKKQTVKKSSSSAAPLDGADNVQADPNLKKDGKSHSKKGKKTKADGTESKSSSKKTRSSEKKKRAPQPIDEEVIARVLEENTDGVSDINLSERHERGKRHSKKSSSGHKRDKESEKTVPKNQYYVRDDSSDDDVLLRVRRPENDEDCGLPCQFCGALFSPFNLMDHQQECGLHQDMVLPKKKQNKKKSSQEQKEATVTCQICSQKIPYMRYRSHQIMHEMGVID